MEIPKPREQMNFIGVGVTLLILIVLTFLVDLSEFKSFVAEAGVWGPLIFILLKISTVVIAPLSGSPLYPLVGLLFGFWSGVLYVAIGDFMGYTIAFYLSRFFGRKLINQLISNKEEGLISRIVNHVGTTKGFFQACLTLLALPEVLSYGAGLSRLPYLKFISILWPIFTVITTILVFFGSSLKPSNGSLFVGLLIPAIGAITMIVGGALFLRGVKKREKNL